jgi:hypothetical protein
VVIMTAAVVTAVAWWFGRLVGVDYVAETPMGVRVVSLTATVAATLLAGVLGWAIVLLLRRFATSARLWWMVIGVSVLALSLVPVFGARASAATQITLTALHVLAAGVLIPGLLPARSARPGI